MLANALAISTSNCLRPYENKQHIIQEKYIPAVPDNQRYLQVFEGDKKIEDFLQSKNEFELPSLDSDYEQDCPMEENLLDEEVKSPEIADINMLPNKLEHTTATNTDLEK